MTLDARIKDAIREAVQESGQEMALSDRLIALLEAVADGNLQFTDRDSVHQRLELLYDSVTVSIPDESGEEE